MAATTATSKISPVVTGAGRGKATTYISTKVTGPIKNAAGEDTFATEIIQYDNAQGGGAKTIGSRYPATGKITWNDNASGRTKLNESKFKTASHNQMQSLENELTSTASQRVGLNKASGASNRETASNIGSTVANILGGFTGLGGGGGGGSGNGNPRQSYSKNLCYPTALRRTQQDTLRISVLKYEPRSLGAAGSRNQFGFAGRSSMASRVIGAVTLPIPGGVSDSNKTNWGKGEMNAVDIAKSDAVKSFLGEGGAGGAANSLQDTIAAMQAGSAEVGQGLENMFTQQLTGTSDLLAREGAVMNPNMELLFRGPALRPFSFTYKLSPRDEAESMVIMRIIRMFKQSMAPQTTRSQLFLKAPNTYRLEFRSPRGGRTHKFLPKIKECALADFGVNYTPDGSYMTYDNSSMVSYEMSLSFQEIEPVYNNDMGMGDGDVGF